MLKSMCVRIMTVLLMGAIGWTASLQAANAALISVDLNEGSGDGLLTRDTISGLDWLDITLTVNQTYDQVRTGSWYQAGFTHANMEELLTLFLHAGTPSDGFDLSITYPTETQALAQLLGATIVGEEGSLTTIGFSGSDFFGNTVTTATHPVDSPFSALLAQINYSPPTGNFPTFGEAHFTGGHPFSNEASPYWGSFLIRPAPVPLPGALGLMFSGLSVLIWRMRGRLVR